MKWARGTFVCVRCGAFCFSVQPLEGPTDASTRVCLVCAIRLRLPVTVGVSLTLVLSVAFLIMALTAFCNAWVSYDDGREWRPSLDEPLIYPTPTPRPTPTTP